MCEVDRAGYEVDFRDIAQYNHLAMRMMGAN